MNRILLAFHNPSLAVRWILRGRSNLTQIELHEIERFIEGHGAIVEAGSSDGVDTFRLARHFPKHEIFALEPVREQYDKTKSRVRDLENVKTFNLALSSVTGVVDLFLGKSGDGISGMGSSSLLEPREHLNEFPNIHFSENRKVQAITFEEFIYSNNVNFVDLLWLDIQGLEITVLAQCPKIIQERVKCIHVEVSRIELYKGMPNYGEVIRFLNDIGFDVVIDRVGRISGNLLAVNMAF
jgi:FkbM family methyltransferase